ncbi:CAP domain-containing protein [Kitasatospora sp. HPMI-4]|uniref:CAP domain-containing protein n=1 Tax=Kitasatospora sp. HPMI-4 TaxID=3448443 RepID=UPI003F1D9DEA
MLTSGSGRHRRARRSYTPRLAATAGIAGAGLMLPLLSASGASAAPGSHTYASYAGWQEHHQYHHQAGSGGQRHQAGSHTAPHAARPAGQAPAGKSHASPTASATQAPDTESAQPAADYQGSHGARPTAQASTPSSDASAPSSEASAPSSPSASPSAPAGQAPAATPTATPTAPSATSGSSSDAVQQVLSLINQARAAQGLPAYTITAGLTRSAEAHNQTMAGGCGMSHQCPGEAELGARETAAGVQWNAIGENIGYGGGVGSAAQDIAAMAVSLTQDMLNETPPDDGHRKNILSGEFSHIGIAVYRDAHGTVWLTQDFSN